MVSKKKIFLRFSYYKYMEANDTGGGGAGVAGTASLDPRGLIVKIQVF